MVLSQNTSLIGDVDCSGDINSQDASLILQFVTNVIDSLPCEVNITGLTPEQLQDMINMMEDQLSVNYAASLGGGCDFLYPDGYLGDNISHDLINEFTVPSEKNLYINIFSSDNNAHVYIDDVRVNYGYSNYSNTPGNASVLYLSEGQTISSSTAYEALVTFNGFLIDKKTTPISHDLINEFTVPSGQNLYINIFSSDNNAHVYIDDVRVNYGYSNYSNTPGNSSMLYLSEGQTISSSTSYEALVTFNGYLVDQNYFAECSGAAGATTINSSMVSDGRGVDILYPEGYHGESVVQEFNEVSTYTVPDNQNLYITEIHAPDDNVIVQINNNWIGSFYFSSSHPSNFPLILKSGDVLSTNYSTNTAVFNGLLIQANQLIDPVTEAFNEVSTYTVPDNQNLYITEIHAPDDNVIVQINNNWIGSFYYSSAHPSNFPLLLKSGDVLSTNYSTNTAVFNGYLVDGDYFVTLGAESESETNNIGDNYVVLNEDQYDFTYSVIGDFSCNIQITDSTILESYLYKGITCNLYDNSNELLNSVGVFNHPATYTNWNFGNLILDEQSGQDVHVHIIFMSSLGMIVVDETITFPE